MTRRVMTDAVNRQANTEIADEFIAYLHEQKLEVFKETHMIGKNASREFLHVTHPGQQKSNTSFQPEFRLSKRLLAPMGAKKYPLHCFRQGSQNGEDTHGFYGIVLRRG